MSKSLFVKNVIFKTMQYLRLNLKILHESGTLVSFEVTYEDNRIDSFLVIFHKTRDVQKIERINHRSENLFVEFNEYLLPKNTLDLHNLTRIGACIILEIFIDTHIQQLRENGVKGAKRELIVVTGWGRHSQKGHSRIREDTNKQLHLRKLP